MTDQVSHHCQQVFNCPSSRRMCTNISSGSIISQ